MPYIYVVCLVLLAALLRYELGLVVPNAPIFAVFSPVITLSAFLLGLRPSILAIGLSTVVAWHLFPPPPGTTHDLDTFVDLVIFLCAGGLIACIGEAYHRALQECRKEQEKRWLVLRELAHRGRNTFAVAQGIVTLSLGDDPAMAETINQRFAALFATNQLLTNSEDHTATLKDIIEAELECYGTTRIRASGPEVVLTADLAQALALIIHELGTNAAKYGALSASNGLVTIDWEVAKTNVSLTWTERGGPVIPPPSKPGFGTTLIRSLLKPLNGSAKLDFHPTGLVCHVGFRLKAGD